MSGFSADWLALREPADHRARNVGLSKALAHIFEGRGDVSILDLGCGTGSNLRALSAVLGPRQSWGLVDYDPALLDAARTTLSRWAETTENHGKPLTLKLNSGHAVSVDFVQADISGGVAALLERRPDLVTAAAFFDLVSESWIENFAADLAQRHIPLYTVLTYDGKEEWFPAHEADEMILSAFNAHQRRDKGFGPSAGPTATRCLQKALEAHGYTVHVAPSPWQLGEPDQGLMAQLAEGIAAAATETGHVAHDVAQAWLTERRQATSAIIGHFDLLAIPPSR